ncbi:radical SAM protein [candidate division MSBL1 archaeon SCGC-AAA833F18]|uniref:Radical SAM protein n=1 Tax=candidate division MSBL1 archaeon SCGC-AAA833F18 TaxID=1698257 RepID=A0A133VSC6_9EURY|nr:radical SAM protein [candidate division MSBL1 archaeon SCGC-AAA833F18]
MVEFIRVSEGTGAVLGLWKQKLAIPPTTGYLMTYYDGRCTANCKFCPQARESEADIGKLSRVSWPKREFKNVLEALEENQDELKRICIQSINHPKIVNDLCEILAGIKETSDLPVSISCQPLENKDIQKLADKGIDRLGIPLDAVTPQIFNQIKGENAGGPYRWEDHLRALEEASTILGGEVSTHLIIGLGETEREAVELIQFLHDHGITVGLFAFTPILGTPLAEEDQPPVDAYRRIQLARHLIVNDLTNYSKMKFENGEISDFGASQADISSVLNSGEPFQTSGCPNCNRPFYNESPRGPIYNYPRKLDHEEIESIKSELNLS